MSVAWLTGASRGIGRATAIALAGRGCKLALLGRPSHALDGTLAELAMAGATARVFSCDLRRPEQLDAAARAALAAYGPPDAVIHDAGVVLRASIETTSLEAYDEQLDVNLRAPFLLTRAVLPAMRTAGSGRIVFVGSIASTLGSPGAAAYAASKWGMVGLMKSLAAELAESGLMTVAVLPGSVATRMLEGSGFQPRMTPEDVAETLVHYALDAPLAHNGGVVEMFGT